MRTRHTGHEDATRGEMGELDEAVTGCRACPRLVAWREKVATEKRAAYRDQEYWGRPAPMAATAPAGYLPGTARATCSSPRCTPSAWLTSRSPPTAATG